MPERETSRREEAPEANQSEWIPDSPEWLPRRQGPTAGSVDRAAAGAGAPPTLIDLNGASFEDLRDLGLSVTQAVRVLALREERGRFSSVDELDQVPGMPPELREALKSRTVVRTDEPEA